MKKGRTCSHCGKQLHKEANYCHHCGKHIHGGKEGYHQCSTCKRLVLHGSTYCTHCGAHLVHGQRFRWARVLLSLLVFFVILLAVLLLMITPSSDKEEVAVPPVSEEASVFVSGLRCTDSTQGFEVCGSVSWNGGAYAKAHIPGGEELEETAKQYDDFTYFQLVGSQEGFRVFRAFVYGDSGSLVAESGDGVACEKKKKPVLVSVIEPTHFTKNVQFYTESQSGKPEGSGSVSVSFPANVLSCVINGSFITENGGAKTGVKTFTIKQYCHGASGEFFGEADATHQTVTVDADAFLWNSYQVIDPEPVLYDGFVAYTYTCDPQYLLKKRYYTHVVADGFGSPTLTLDWYYKNDDTQPRVFFTMDLQCLLAP